MTRVGFVGMGKLGLPVALAMESQGHDVVGYDLNPEVEGYIDNRQYPFQEEGVDELLQDTKIQMVELGELVSRSQIIFVPIQTPHEPRFEGTSPLPADRADFDYSYLKEGLKAIVEECGRQAVKRTVVVISTCLPGTFEQEIAPLLSDNIDYVYSPQFIAMGTVIDDYLNPEFNLIGSNNPKATNKLARFYKTINSAPMLDTDIKTAEAIKVSYNTFITMKTVLANAWGEMAHKMGFNIDDIYKAWTMSDDRLISAKYLKAGMGDGGGCHPRDNIALSHLARKVGMSSNIWDDLMRAREYHAIWLANYFAEIINDTELDTPAVILGRSFKPETQIETGSPALLVSHYLDWEHIHVEDLEKLPKTAYLIATQHERYAKYEFPEGSIVLDPFRYIPNRPGVEVIRIGEKEIS